jgi:hypothetical protein
MRTMFPNTCIPFFFPFSFSAMRRLIEP